MNFAAGFRVPPSGMGMPPLHPVAPRSVKHTGAGYVVDSATQAR